MNTSSFKDRSEVLAELCGLKRQSVCFQIMTLMQMCHRGLDEGVVKQYELNGQMYYEFRSLQQYMANIKTVSNAKAGLGVLTENGFLDKLVISKNGDIITDPSYFRGDVSIFYRLSNKGQLLFGLGL
ncbi:hypothetical protein OPW33_17340 [Vibrio europaeus]|uniref:hypothetical protein n=1 Tax=Vibrio europaeus TaxID=300876 RepID=UPI0023415C15|nr:hypothetical protein [Vibrio europaeus]MDC5841089.1 hypothetical protein [Vibrio europaeus]